MSQCAVPRCKRAARHPGLLCVAHWGSLDESVRAEMDALAQAAKSGGERERVAYDRKRGQLAMLLAQGVSPMKADP